MVVGRFAPSPSGRLHLGNLFCCLLAWLSARQQEGRVVLRVEDLDTARCPRRYAVQAMEDLQWLGLTWDEGPGVGGAEGPYFQSERTALYRAALKKLEDMGLGVPAMTRVFARLRAMGLEVPASVYTVEQARDAVLAALERKQTAPSQQSPRQAGVRLPGEGKKEPADMTFSASLAEDELEQASSEEGGAV